MVLEVRVLTLGWVVGVLSGRRHKVLPRGAKKILDLHMIYNVCGHFMKTELYTYYFCTFCMYFMCMHAQLLNHI